MKRNLIGFIDTDNKRINYASQREFERAMSDFGPGAKVNIIIETYRRKRSPSQNNLLHMYLGIIADYTGQDIQTIKDICKMQFGIKEPMLDKNGEEIVDKDTGELMDVFKSSRDYNTAEMTEFINNIVDWGVLTFHLTFPDPEDLRNNNLKI